MSSVSELEDSISSSSSKAGACTTRSQCDAFASRTFGGPVKPIPVQGAFSYTVAAANDTVIVQDSPLDMQILGTVQAIHPGFVADRSYHGTIGSSLTLLIYSMNMLPGDTYFNISLSLLDGDFDHQLTTVRSLARFFAQSWQGRSHSDPDAITADLENCHSSFSYLSSNLPSRFQKTIARIKENLSALFSGEYPLVLTHGDLSERNILANPETGEVTGIIDWAEAGILPFGFTLYALDHMLGYLTLDGWVFHDTAEYLRDEFWRVFCELAGGVSQGDMELIQLATLAGLFLRYGIPYKPGRKGVVGVGGSLRLSFSTEPKPAPDATEEEWG
ncbi:hypothetical protein C8A03DRAFT_42274 [Achaetomium macrosporum]|uniref:Aminoglycoside phosphotransferase domain-containing protein n=1 Tax=Achaetomium macrosporum TaxID=79813 RepID=A0AAN7CEK6_9PEZI|nr:hypothetical protein C8A03DRAFT_42274 [Achaetomium macrosporum]